MRAPLTKQVTVELLPVLVELQAQPGDHVMVLDGRVIGVSTERRDPGRPRAAETPLLSAPAPKPPAPPPREKRQGIWGQPDNGSGRADRATARAQREAILEAMRRLGRPVTLGDVAIALRIGGTDDYAYDQVRRGLRDLRVIEGRVRTAAGEGTQQTYVPVDPEPATPAPELQTA